MIPKKNTVRALNLLIPLMVINVWVYVSIFGQGGPVMADMPTGVYVFAAIFTGGKVAEKYAEVIKVGKES